MTTYPAHDGLSTALAESAVQAEPTELHLLYVRGPRSPADWLSRALDDCAPYRVRVVETPSLMLALEQLRTEVFDVVLLDCDTTARAPADVLQAIRCSANEHQAVLILGDDDDRRSAAAYLDEGASGYLSLRLTTPHELLWQVTLAAERGRLLAENQQLRAWQRRQEAHEQQETLKLLDEQQAIFRYGAPRCDYRGLSDSATESGRSARLAGRYRELLQAYVVMGRGQLTAEVERFAAELPRDGLPLSQLLDGFTEALRGLVRDRGGRSARHVYDRGNLLLLELLLKWADRAGQPLTSTRAHGPSLDEPLQV
jgi:DNA-binding NarL/FixJ family response regulator